MNEKQKQQCRIHSRQEIHKLAEEIVSFYDPEESDIEELVEEKYSTAAVLDMNWPSHISLEAFQ